MSLPGEDGDEFEVGKVDGLEAGQWSRLRRRSILLHEVSGEFVDQFIADASDVTAEVEDEFRKRINTSFSAMMQEVAEMYGPVVLPLEVEERLRSEMERFHIRYDDPTPIIRRLAHRPIEFEARGWEEWEGEGENEE